LIVPSGQHEERSNRKTTEAGAIVRKPIEGLNKSAVVAYVELKNELGDAGTEGSETHYRRIYRSASMSLRAVFVDSMKFCTENTSEVFSVQNLKGYIYVGGDPTETEQVYCVAKVFDAVARAVNALEREYFFPNPESPLEFRSPSPTYLQNSPFPTSGPSFKFRERFM